MTQGLLAYRRIADALAALFCPHLQIRVEEAVSGRVVHDTRRAGRHSAPDCPVGTGSGPAAPDRLGVGLRQDRPVAVSTSLAVDVPPLDSSGRRCRLIFSRDPDLPPVTGRPATATLAEVSGVPAAGGLSAQTIATLTAYVDRRIDRPLSVADLARTAGLSEKHFARCFALSTGLPPRRWLIRRRIETAQRMMSLGDLSLCEIALACGFADQSHFTTSFTRIIGSSPGRWRRDAAQVAHAALQLPAPASFPRAPKADHEPFVTRAVADLTRFAGQPEAVMPG